MAKYIDADKALKRIKELQETAPSTVGKKQFAEGFFCGLDEAEAVLIQAPAADVVEVKHGYWSKTDRGIRTDLNTGKPMRVYACDCSCCGWHTGNQGIDFKYCHAAVLAWMAKFNDTKRAENR